MPQLDICSCCIYKNRDKSVSERKPNREKIENAIRSLPIDEIQQDSQVERNVKAEYFGKQEVIIIVDRSVKANI